MLNNKGSENPYYSVVIPVYNESEVLIELHQRLSSVLGGLGRDYEIIFIDDGSKDDSYGLLRELHRKDKRVKVIKLSRNFGHHLAITSGIDFSKGEVVILMDADLQDKPEEIPSLLKKIEEGYDVAYAIREERKDAFFKKVTSALFVMALNKIIHLDVPINSCIFRAVRRKVVDNLKGFKEHSRFISGLISWVGFSQVGVKVKHGPRQHGSSKYSFLKMVKLAVNTVTSFSYFPLQLAMLLGFTVSFISFILMVFMVYKKLFLGMAVLGYASIIVSILFIGGVQLIILGVIGEYIGRIYTETQKRPLYIIDNLLE